MLKGITVPRIIAVKFSLDISFKFLKLNLSFIN